MTRIVVMTDVHANLPALQAAMAVIRAEGYDVLIHTGDAIAIGPHPAECLDVLLNTPRVRFVMGNHDDWFVHGLPQPQPAWMSNGELAHQHWTHAQLDPALRASVAQWPFVIHECIEDVPLAFMHYGLDASGRNFEWAGQNPSIEALDGLFALASQDKQIVFHSHDHVFRDVHGRARYVNSGALGCHIASLARYAVVTCERGSASVSHRIVPYDDASLFEAFERRAVPERVFIYRAFLGGRFATLAPQSA